MAKYRRSWNENKLNKRIDEGRGQGVGAEYKPWITIHDLSSKGLSSRQPGWKTNRVCHFLSKKELSFFYILEWSDIVIDTREQYPLFPIEETMEIAEELGIKHPIDNVSKTPYVLTSDFMIIVKSDDKEKEIVRTIKMTEEIEEDRVLEKLNIERVYWKRRGVNWGIVSEKDIPEIMIENIEWIYFHYHLEPTAELDIEELLAIGEILKEKLEQSDSTLGRVASKLDKELNIETGTCLYLLRHLIAKKEVVLDMIKKIGAASRTSDILKIVKYNNRVKAI